MCLLIHVDVLIYLGLLLLLLLLLRFHVRCLDFDRQCAESAEVRPRERLGHRGRQRERDTETHRQSDRRRDRTGDHFEGPCEKRAAVVMAIVAPVAVVVVVVLVAVQLQLEGCVTLNLPQTVVFVLFAYDHLRDHVGSPRKC